MYELSVESTTDMCTREIVYEVLQASTDCVKNELHDGGNWQLAHTQET